jgi:hypothetical protein
MTINVLHIIFNKYVNRIVLMLYFASNKNNMYTSETRKSIYLLIKGAGLISDLETKTGHTRATLSNIFHKYEGDSNKRVVEVAIKLLRTNGILADIQTLTEILN